MRLGDTEDPYWHGICRTDAESGACPLLHSADKSLRSDRSGTSLRCRIEPEIPGDSGLRLALEESLHHAPDDPIILRFLKKRGTDLLGAPVENKLVQEEQQLRCAWLGLRM